MEVIQVYGFWDVVSGCYSISSPQAFIQMYKQQPIFLGGVFVTLGLRGRLAKEAKTMQVNSAYLYIQIIVRILNLKFPYLKILFCITLTLKGSRVFLFFILIHDLA